MAVLWWLLATLATSSIGMEVAVDFRGDESSRTALIRKQDDTQPTLHPCDDKSKCTGCGGLSQASCEKACWIDDNKQNRQCIWSTLLECVDKTEGVAGALC
ncbi:unnamed protein product [Cladocopium goreaui]|uniref:Glutamate receptor 3.2 n=2 Tax=Cladocopium goreaui TaxID=2562237 RepID=A0A9P1CYP5_9DINO|nr:unnamed protein product [Cladocopium goreaui]